MPFIVIALLVIPIFIAMYLVYNILNKPTLYPFYGSDSPGNDIFCSPNISAETCRQKCLANPECAAYGFDPAQNNWCCNKRVVNWPLKKWTPDGHLAVKTTSIPYSTLDKTTKDRKKLTNNRLTGYDMLLAAQYPDKCARSCMQSPYCAAYTSNGGDCTHHTKTLNDIPMRDPVPLVAGMIYEEWN